MCQHGAKDSFVCDNCKKKRPRTELAALRTYEYLTVLGFICSSCVNRWHLSGKLSQMMIDLISIGEDIEILPTYRFPEREATSGRE